MYSEDLKTVKAIALGITLGMLCSYINAYGRDWIGFILAFLVLVIGML